MPCSAPGSRTYCRTRLEALTRHRCRRTGRTEASRGGGPSSRGCIGPTRMEVCMRKPLVFRPLWSRRRSPCRGRRTAKRLLRGGRREPAARLCHGRLCDGRGRRRLKRRHAVGRAWERPRGLADDIAGFGGPRTSSLAIVASDALEPADRRGTAKEMSRPRSPRSRTSTTRRRLARPPRRSGRRRSPAAVGPRRCGQRQDATWLPRFVERAGVRRRRGRQGRAR